MDDFTEPVHREAERDRAVLMSLRLLCVVPCRFLNDTSRISGETKFDVVRLVASVNGPGIAEVAT